jgi:hypothetical protein
MLGASIYDGSVRKAVIVIACAGLVVATVYLLRPLICGGPIVHHPEELARD